MSQWRTSHRLLSLFISSATGTRRGLANFEEEYYGSHEPSSRAVLSNPNRP